MSASSSSHLTAMKNKVTDILRPVYPLAQIYINNLPPDMEDSQVNAVIRQIGGPYDSKTNLKSVGIQISIVSYQNEIALNAIDLVFGSLRDVELASNLSDTGTKLVVSATTTPNYDGVDESGSPIYSCMFEIVAIH